MLNVLAKIAHNPIPPTPLPYHPHPTPLHPTCGTGVCGSVTHMTELLVQSVVVAFSRLARIWGGCSAIHSLPVFFFLLLFCCCCF